MDCGDYTIQKIQLILTQISQLRESEFPHSDSKEALVLLQRVFEKDKQRIESCIEVGESTIKKQACAEANFHIARYLPILGFVLRSTNTRNAFELFVPLAQLSRRILKRDDVKLILSSEWDYAPFTYPLVFSELPNFVFIGLPASESENPLIIPLSGHELGHSVWRVYKLASHFTLVLKEIILDEIKKGWSQFEKLFSTGANHKDLDADLELISIWSSALEWSQRQLEEIFCDAIGVRLFGESYFYAMEYLLSPDFKNRRSIYYPSIITRTRAVVQAAEMFEIPSLEDFETRFTETSAQLHAKQQFLLDISDRATDHAIKDAITAAGVIADGTSILSPVSVEVTRLLECFKTGIPAHGLKNLADIINAGWKVYIGGTGVALQTAQGEQFDRLADVIPKTIEVMEFEIRTRIA